MSRVEILGGKVTYDFEQAATLKRGPFHGILGDDYFATVVKVDLSSSAVTDNDLLLFRAFPNMAWLGLYDTEISDVGLKPVGTFTQLGSMKRRSRTREFAS